MTSFPMSSAVKAPQSSGQVFGVGLRKRSQLNIDSQFNPFRVSISFTDHNSPFLGAVLNLNAERVMIVHTKIIKSIPSCSGSLTLCTL